MQSSGSSIFKIRNDSSRLVQEKDSKRNYTRDFLCSLRKFWLHIITVVVFSALYAYTFVMTTRVLGQLIDLFVSSTISSVINGENTVSDNLMKQNIMNAAIFIIANTVLSYVQGVVASRFASGYSFNIRQRLFDKFNHLPMKYIDSHFHDNIFAVMTDSADAVNQCIYVIFGKMLSSVFVVVGIFAELFRIDLLIALLVMVVVIVSFTVIYFVSFTETASAAEHQQKLQKVHSEISEFYNGIKVMQNSGRCDEITESICDLNEDLCRAVKKARSVSSANAIITEIITIFSLIIVLVAGAIKIHSGVFSLGVLITFVIYIRKMNEPLSQISLFSSTVKTLDYTKNTIFDFLNEEEIPCRNEENQIINGDIEFKNVNFAYYGNQNVIKNASFTINSKGITAITGETGAGKSTIIKLILNFYSPSSGKITMGDRDISHYDPSLYRQMFTIIPQNAQLFECTIRDNIAYGMENVTEESIIEAAKSVGADEFIRKLPEGYNTQYSPAAENLSSGQVQLILLAGAVLRKCNFIIFDEATSFIDAVSENTLNCLLKKLSVSCGIIIIAHRKTAIEIAEKEIKISDGKITVG